MSLWASSIYLEKQRLQKRIFPEGIYYDKKNDKSRTTKMNSLFAVVADVAGISTKNETRPSEVILKKSGLVTPERLELSAR